MKNFCRASLDSLYAEAEKRAEVIEAELKSGEEEKETELVHSMDPQLPPSFPMPDKEISDESMIHVPIEELRDIFNRIDPQKLRECKK